MYTLDFISFRVYPPPLNLQNHVLKHFKVATFLIVNKTLSDNFNLMHIWLKCNKQAKKNLGFEVQTWKYQDKSSKMCVIFLHFHFSIWTFFMQRNNLHKKLPIHGIQKVPKLFSFNIKQMLKHSDVYLRFY